jgi:hypothetical protein
MADRSFCACWFPRPLLWLAALYFLASLMHFTHNAEYIALYPNMPIWLSREHVYLAWLAVTAVGGASALMWAFGWRAVALVTLGLYGALALRETGLGRLARTRTDV